MGRHRSKSRSRSRTPVESRLLKLANMGGLAEKIRLEKGKRKGEREWDKDKKLQPMVAVEPRRRSRSRSDSRGRDRKRKGSRGGTLPEREKSKRSRSRSRSKTGRSKDSGDRSRSKDKRHKDKKDKDRGGKDKDKSANGKHKEKKSKKSKSKKKKSKSKRRSTSSDSESDSSVSSADSLVLLQRLEEERKKQRVEEKRRKEEMKALETPEEKRQRRLEKKEIKERKRKERMGWDPEHLHYTNSDNPFGDHDLMGTFVWKKKLEKEGMKDLSKEEIERRNRLLADENKRELEKVKQRRIEKERETQARDEEQQLVQRQKEAAQFQEWGKQEDVFHLEQARLRSKIRITDGRAKPIDLLAQYVSAEDEVDAIEMHEPYSYLNGLTIADLEDLLEDIVVYKELEKGKNLSYWNDITVIVEDELRKLRKLEQDDDYRMAVERREGINSAVAQDVSELLKGKTAEKLEELKISIQSKLDGSVHGLDISYWESLLSQLKAYIARARLRDRHQDNLKAKLQILKTQQGVKVEAESETEEDTSTDHVVPAPSKPMDIEESSKAPEAEVKDEEEELEEEDEAQTDIVEESIHRYDIGGYSPKIITLEEIEPGIFVIGEDEDNARLDLARSQVLKVGLKVENVWTAEERALEKEAKKGITDDEAGFSVESQVDQLYLWSDKYRPRKPRYFNRVHTGFEWNKYNQTHYDMDNPPPKIVQGYKFNIFYPDLIDKNSTPRYSVTACADNPDFAILRFIAGPPYEDIAFKVVNREWEYSYKRGFRCQFQNNIFQLWYHFKRYRYRR